MMLSLVWGSMAVDRSKMLRELVFFQPPMVSTRIVSNAIWSRKAGVYEWS
jgi:hypothetical protein